MARVLIVGGGCRGRRLAAALADEGHAVCITTRSEEDRAAIEASGAECWVGTPDRLETLSGVLDHVTIACWLLGTAHGSEAELAALHGSRLELFITRAIDSTVRGFVYEAAGTVGPALLAGGARIAQALAQRNAIPLMLLSADPTDVDAWLACALDAVTALLHSPRPDPRA